MFYLQLKQKCLQLKEHPHASSTKIRETSRGLWKNCHLVIHEDTSNRLTEREREKIRTFLGRSNTFCFLRHTLHAQQETVPFLLRFFTCFPSRGNHLQPTDRTSSHEENASERYKSYHFNKLRKDIIFMDKQAKNNHH